MALWWVGNAVLLVVALVVVVLATRILRRINQLNALADRTLEAGVGISSELDALPALLQTRDLSVAARDVVGRYGAALTGLLTRG